jgi:hypothetical protein
MALTEKIEIDRIEIVNTWNVQVRQATVIERDGEFVSKTFHRWLFNPDSDISGQEQKVQDIANAEWTTEVKLAFEAFKKEQNAKLGAK